MKDIQCIKVSIIVPVYNVEKYLRRCLDSIVNQTFKDFEVICINDGSTDKSLDILNNYAGKDNRIIVLSQENSKQGAARNRGLDIAKGKYITFVDADDWIDLNYLDFMLKAAANNNSDMAVSVSTRDYPHKVKQHVTIKSLEIETDINKLLKKINYDLRVTGKMYRASILKDLRFIENIFYEDAPYAIRAISKAQNPVLVPDTVYHYFSNPNSTIKKRLDKNLIQDKITSQFDLINYAYYNNIVLKENLLYKENHFLWKIKHYIDKREYYLCGIKIFSKSVPYIKTEENKNEPELRKLFITTGLISLVNVLAIIRNEKKISYKTLAVLSFNSSSKFIDNVKKIANFYGFNEVLFFNKDKDLNKLDFNSYDEVYTNPTSKILKACNRHKACYLYDEGPAFITGDFSKYKNIKRYYSSNFLGKLELPVPPKNAVYLNIRKEDFLFVSKEIINLSGQDSSLNTKKNLLFIGHYIYRKLGDEFVLNWYKKNIDYFINLGYNVYFKSHPRDIDIMIPMLEKYYENNKNFHLFDSDFPIEIYDYDFDLTAGAYSGALISLPHYRNIPAVQLKMKELYKSGIGIMTKRCCALFDNYIPSFAEMEPCLNQDRDVIFKNYEKIISEKEVSSKNEKLKKVFLYKRNLFKDILWGVLIYLCFFNKELSRKIKNFSRKDFDFLVSQSINEEL